MRAAAILGLGCSPRNLKPFQNNQGFGRAIDWRMGVPVADDEVDIILLLGGDGTIHRHLSQLVHLGLPVLIVPGGSGNDFARALGLRRLNDSLAAWRQFLAGKENIRSVDLGLISPLPDGSSRQQQEDETRYFCCAAGVGLDAEIARRANQLPRWMRANGGYALSLAPALFRFAPVRVKVHTPSRTSPASDKPGWTLQCDEPTVIAVFANTPVYGGGMRVAPHARMEDGLLDACLVTDISRLKLFCLFPTVYFGRHLGMREVKYFQSERLRIETEHPREVYADGEFVCRTPIEIGVRRAALKVLTP